MIQFVDVFLSFAGKILFENVSFALQPSEKCALLGRNGSGKSTLFRLIAGELEPDGGSISMPKGYRVGYLQQHIRFSQPTLVQEASLGVAPHELYQVEKILFGLGFTQKDLDASPDSFSGGFQLRLHLAKVLASFPDCLLLDEPTNYLDIVSIRWLSQFLMRWKGALIMISHDREFLDQICHSTMGLHRQKIRKFQGNTSHYYEKIVIEEEVYEKTRLKFEKKRLKTEEFIDRFGAKATKAGQAQAKLKMLMREPSLEKLNQIASLSFSFREACFFGKKMLEAKHLEFSYTENPLIQDVSLEIGKKERIAIIGKNGRGKSTLLQLLGGFLAPLKGSLKMADAVNIGYFGQTNIDRLNAVNTIEEEIAIGNPLLSRTEVKAIAGLMMFSGDDALKPISVLSGGEKSRVLLGKILAKPCNLLLLDEPTHHLDIESIEALLEALEEFEGSLIIVTHSELILRRLNLHQIVVCEAQKQRVFLGNYDEFLEKIGWEEEVKKEEVILKPELPHRGSKSLKKSSAEKKIQACEQEIRLLEEAQEKDLLLLSDKSRFQEISRSMSLRQEKIDSLHQELDALYHEFLNS